MIDVQKAMHGLGYVTNSCFMKFRWWKIESFLFHFVTLFISAGFKPALPWVSGPYEPKVLTGRH